MSLNQSSATLVDFIIRASSGFIDFFNIFCISFNLSLYLANGILTIS